MPYREGALPPRDPPGVSLAAPWVVLAVVAGTGLPLLSDHLRRQVVEAWRESGAIAPALLEISVALFLAVAVSAAFGNRVRERARWLAPFAPAIVSLVAWIGTLLPVHPSRGGSFELGPEILRLVRSCALLTAGSRLVAFVAIGSAAAAAVPLWQLLPSAARPTAFRRAARRGVVVMLAGVLGIGVACAFQWKFAMMPVATLWFGSVALAIVMAAWTWLGLLDYGDARAGAIAAIFVCTSAITATLAAGRIDQHDAETYRVFHCFNSPSVLWLFAEHAGNLVVGRQRLSIAAALCAPAVFALVAATVRATRSRHPTRRESIAAFAAIALTISIPVLALRALHTPGYSFARARLDRAADYDDRDLHITRLDRDGSYGEPTRGALGIGRRSIWQDGRELATFGSFFADTSRRTTRQLVEQLARHEWPEVAHVDHAIRLAVDGSHPVSVIADVLDLAREGDTIRCGLVHALADRQVAWLPSWLDDVRRPHEAIWFNYGGRVVSIPPDAVHVVVRRDGISVDAPGIAPIEIAAGTDPRELREGLWKLARRDELPFRAVLVDVDAQVRVEVLMRALDAVAPDPGTFVRIIR